MTTPTIEILTDLPPILTLLEQCGLRVADIEPARPPLFLGVRGDAGLLAVVGLEVYGQLGLLRSLAVLPAARGQGFGQALVAYVEDYAAGHGIGALYLLTTSAALFFSRLGFQAAERSSAPAAIRASSQFSALCPSSSALLYKLVAAQAHGRDDRQEKNANTALATLKVELEQFGIANDSANSERPRRMLNITRDTGEFLAVLVRATQARRVLEIGTSNGYSTLWLAEAVQAIDGRVTTVEYSESKVALATENFARAGLAERITLVHDDAGQLLAATPEAAYDLVFLDSERPEYPGWWPHLRRVLRPGGLLVVDNATSHAEQMQPLVDLVYADAEFTTSLVPVGNGEFLAVKAG
jgi:predicted O-methyltransferase YrrM/N-acetylglutamate synthase-like GNAT family acetyltransferase